MYADRSYLLVGVCRWRCEGGEASNFSTHVVAGALMANDELSRALADYDNLKQGLTVPPAASTAAQGPASSGGAAAAGSSSRGGAAPGVFSLLWKG